MKTLITSLLLATALVPAVLSAASANSTRYAIPVEQVTADDMQIRTGATETAVKAALGEPLERLSADIWVYYNFHSNHQLAKNLGCNTLMVTLENGKVASLKLLSRNSVQIVARNLRKAPAPAATYVAQKK